MYNKMEPDLLKNTLYYSKDQSVHVYFEYDSDVDAKFLSIVMLRIILYGCKTLESVNGDIFSRFEDSAILACSNDSTKMVLFCNKHTGIWEKKKKYKNCSQNSSVDAGHSKYIVLTKGFFIAIIVGTIVGICIAMLVLFRIIYKNKSKKKSTKIFQVKTEMNEKISLIDSDQDLSKQNEFNVYESDYDKRKYRQNCGASNFKIESEDYICTCDCKNI
ncbi:hypothetical protein A3Q56_05074 [Intoshia linei]|uniref:Uncharacterized protein n=1 Tax=Intoshia linei TaxID=1819745 RepID=A0A177B0N0_9BILA|nr:hypothetical protein A3Q56_05074 [Intoshia linei]